MTTHSSKRIPAANWSSTQALILAVICLWLGIAGGYLLRESPTVERSQHTAQPQAGGAPPTSAAGQVIPEQLRGAVEKQIQPLLARLKTTPNDPQLLATLGNIYFDTKNFNEAIKYYEASVTAKDDPDVRTDLGSAYFYAGDPDKAIAEFENALKLDPKHANAWFDIAMVRWQGKKDREGAIAAWNQLLAFHPKHPGKAQIESLIARAK